MERIDCEKCRNGHFEGDKLRCRLKKCQPDYEDMQEEISEAVKENYEQNQ